MILYCTVTGIGSTLSTRRDTGSTFSASTDTGSTLSTGRIGLVLVMDISRNEKVLDWYWS